MTATTTIETDRVNRRYIGLQYVPSCWPVGDGGGGGGEMNYSDTDTGLPFSFIRSYHVAS